MDRENGTEGCGDSAGPSRRRLLRHAGTGLLVGTGLSGVAAAERGSGRSETAGRPTVAGSAPSCETLRVDYVSGNPPVSVTVEGPETRQTRLDDDSRSVTWTVTPGEYELTAAPGNGRGKGTPAVVVEGSPVTVTGCRPSDPNEVEPTGLSVSATCLTSTDSAVRYTVANPTSDDATVVVSVVGSTSYEIETTVAAGASTTVPESGELTANGEWTHEFTATRAGGGSMTVNGDDVWSKTPDCS